MVDISNSESFNSIKELVASLKPEESYIKNILVLNKNDNESGKQVKDIEIQEFLNIYSKFGKIQISLKNSDNYLELLNEIDKSINQNKNFLSTNYVTECITNNKKVTSRIISQNTIRVVLLGDSMVGKTAFLTRYFKNTFTETFLSTIGIDDETKFIKINDEKCKLIIWDTAGQERFRSLPKKYYQNADGIFLLFDVTKPESFKNVSSWMKDIQNNANRGNDTSSIIIYLLGNKIDMNEREISKEEAKNLADELKMKYCEISCKLNINITEVIYNMVIDCYKKNTGNSGFTINNKNTNQNVEKGGCCSKKKN
jgi:Ras-related protein Rab-8A